ncbi:hypothetical protein [Streptomyces sp. NPDC029721]|uniref:hypothetical protein n=1 Tax=Streptomyces sp. NPDC029721 TaxID=3157090 RepID=UPI0034083C83
MFAHRRKAWGISLAAVAVGLATSAAAWPGAPAAGAPGADCAGARAGIERLEGRITPNVCAFLQRQLAFGGMPTGDAPLTGDKALQHPRVAAYLDIFDPAATLWEAGSAPRTGQPVIGAAIAGSLRLAPDLRYTGTNVVADGGVVMFGQWNTATVKGHKVAYPQIARNVLGDGGRTLQARRYYDRHVLVRDTLPDAPEGLFDGIADSGGPPAPGPAPARLAGPGLAAPLVTKAGKRDYLQRLLDRADLELKAGQVAFGKTTTYVEWYGTVSRKRATPNGENGPAVPFGIVERFGPDGEWELYFDTLPVLADQDTINGLLTRLATP